MDGVGAQGKVKLVKWGLWWTAWKEIQNWQNGKLEADRSTSYRALEVTLTWEKRVHPEISGTKVRREPQRERIGVVQEQRLKHTEFHHLKVSLFFLLRIFHFWKLVYRLNRWSDHWLANQIHHLRGSLWKGYDWFIWKSSSPRHPFTYHATFISFDSEKNSVCSQLKAC